MKVSPTALFCAIAVLVAFCSFGTSQENARFDLIVRGGRVIDGTGNPWRYADVGISGGKITAVGNLRHATAKQIIDATGRYVCPGFIDLHSHSDLPLLVDGNAESKICQGVTTEILGESISAGPVAASLSSPQADARRLGVAMDWNTLDGYFQRLGRSGSAVNVASYVGLGSLRGSVLGLENRRATPVEMQRMRQLLARAMQQGALGLSTSLIEFPDRYASTEEIIELARVAASYGGIFAIHMRSERRQILAALDEAIRIGKEAGIPVEIFHFKVSGQPNWGQMPAAIAKIEAARRAGIDITANQYPYTASTDPLEVLLPTWAREGGTQAMLQRLSDPGLRQRIQQEMAQAPPGGDDLFRDYQAVMISRVGSGRNRNLVGKRVAEIAAERGQDPKNTIFDLIREERSDIDIVNFVINEDEARLAMRQPWVSPGSDGLALNVKGILAEGHPHPRSFGTFPRILGRYVREDHVVPLEEAIRKMTSAGAHRLGLQGRGEIRAGMWADVVVFDLETVGDRADFTRPQQYPSGIEYVLVNGEVVIDHGAHTGRRPGRILYGPGYRQH